MDVYLDLSLFAHLLLSLSSILFVHILSSMKVKKRHYLFFALKDCGTVFLIYFNPFLGLAIFAITSLLLHLLLFKKKGITTAFLYLFSYLGESFCLSFFIKGMAFKSNILVISQPKGAIGLLGIVVFSAALVLSSLMVDKLYRLKDFKVQSIIYYKNQKAIFDCYFDSGNTLKYKNIPVIFVLRKNWCFKTTGTFERIEVSSINGESVYYGVQALIEIENSTESYFVYVILIDDTASFNGCECLLNAYLV